MINAFSCGTLARESIHIEMPANLARNESRASGGETRTGETDYQALCVDDPVEARAIWYVAPRSGAVMCPAYVARP